MNIPHPDSKYMAQALELAALGLYSADPNPRVGCVIVDARGRSCGGYHQKAGLPHAEINAMAAANEQGIRLRGATAYVTLEPCSHQGKTGPCADALIAAGIERVVVAMIDPNPLVAGKGIEKLRQAGVEVHTGVLEADARALNPGFIKRMESRLPFVRVKLAMSLDGKTAMANGESQWITGTDARNDGHKLRARSSAVLTGVGTVQADNPLLNVRIPEAQFKVGGQKMIRQPRAVILDTRGRLNASFSVMQRQDEVLWITASASDGEGMAVPHVQLAKKEERLDLHQVLRYLGDQQMNEVLVEAGPVLSGAFIQQRLVDELVVYVGPKLLGHQAKALVHLPGLDHLCDAPDLRLQHVEKTGPDLKLVYTFQSLS